MRRCAPTASRLPRRLAAFQITCAFGLLIALAVPVNATTYYVSATGDDSNPGTSASSPWRTIAKVQGEMGAGRFKPGDSILFQRGGVWEEQLNIPSGVNGAVGNPITLGNYGSGALPVIDGGSIRAACIAAVYVNVSYITVDGFECRNTTEYGINFNAGSSLPRIIIENNYVHNTGPGACSGCGTPHDDGNYRNQINFEIDSTSTGQKSGVQILNNTVENAGGHNSIEVHHDEGSPLVRGNTLSDCAPHGCIDLKGVVGAVVDSNTVANPNASSNQPAIYNENTFVPEDSIEIHRNYIYDTPVGIQIESGISSSYPCNNGSCAINASIYNNTLYETPSAYSLVSTSCDSAPLSFAIKNNLIDGGQVDMHSGCAITWDYNDDGGSQGLSLFDLNDTRYSSAYGAHDLWHADPLYADDPLTSITALLGGLLPGSPCIYAGVAVGLPYTGPEPTIGAWNPPASTPTPTPTPAPVSTPIPSASPTPTAGLSPTPVASLAYVSLPANGASNVCGQEVPVTVVQPSSVVWTDVYAGGTWIASTDQPLTTFNWNSTGVPNGPVSLTVNSYSSTNSDLGQTSNQITVNNAACYGYFASPGDGATVNGKANLVINQPSNVCWTNVYVNGTWIDSTDRPTMTYAWDSTSVANGPNRLSINSYNCRNGLVGTNSIDVNVDN